MITSAGKAVIAQLVAGESVPGWSIAVGFGTAPPSEDDTGLGFEVGRAAATVQVVGNRAVYRALITVPQSGILSEVGLFAGSTLVSRRVSQGQWVPSGVMVSCEVILEFIGG